MRTLGELPTSFTALTLGRGGEREGRMGDDTILYYTIQYYTILYYTILYCTLA